MPVLSLTALVLVTRARPAPTPIPGVQEAIFSRVTTSGVVVQVYLYRLRAYGEGRRRGDYHRPHSRLVFLGVDPCRNQRRE